MDSRAKTNMIEQDVLKILLFLFAHIPLGLVLYYGPRQLSTLHGLAVLGIGIYFAISKAPIERVAFAAAYIAGSEVLWRMSQASLFWEYGKYAASLIFLLAIFRNRNAKFPILPILSFLFLLPAIIPTFIDSGWTYARDEISFNLSGHLALMLGACYFSQLKLQRQERISLLVSLIAPIIATGMIVLITLFTSDQVTWGTESNFAASGGFGPNQVSTTLGLGFAAAVILVLEIKRIRSLFSVVMVFVAIWLLSQAFLTFSRGGVYTGLASAALGFAFYVHDNKFRNAKELIFVVGLLGVAIYFLLPALNDFTAGSLGSRFTDLNTTHRGEVAAVELDVFLDNPVTGVGVGQSKTLSERVLGGAIAAHTEYTRILSDHGLLGVFSLALLGTALAQRFFNPELKSRGFFAFALMWFGLTLAHSAMRIFAPSFMAALLFIQPSEADE